MGSSHSAWQLCHLESLQIKRIVFWHTQICQFMWQLHSKEMCNTTFDANFFYFFGFTALDYFKICNLVNFYTVYFNHLQIVVLNHCVLVFQRNWSKKKFMWNGINICCGQNNFHNLGNAFLDAFYIYKSYGLLPQLWHLNCHHDVCIAVWWMAPQSGPKIW